MRGYETKFIISEFLHRRFHQRGIHYAWVVVASVFFTMLTTAAVIGAPGVLIKPLETEFGWTTAQISNALAIRFMLFGLMAPFSAALMTRFGIRKVTFTALSTILLGLLLSLVMTQLWQLFVCYGLILGFGTGLTALVLGATVSARWFTKRRGLVVGILTASSATGQLVFLPVLAKLSEGGDWRAAVGCMCFVIIVALILVIAFLRERPSDLGIHPYGEISSEPPAPSPALKALSPFTVLLESSKSRMFWILFVTFFICGASTNGLIQTHFVSFCGDNGMPTVAAASVLAMMGIFDFFGTIGSGYLSDRFDNRVLLFVYYGLRGISLLMLPHANFTLYGLSLFSMFYGLDWIATVPPTLKLVVECFGKERAPLVFGWVFAGHQIGAATAALGGGYIRTAYLTYVPAFIIAGALCIFAAILMLFARYPKRVAAGQTVPR
jgi:MFS family permease